MRRPGRREKRAPDDGLPRAEYRFVLNDVLDISRYAHLDRFAAAPPDIVDAVLAEAARFSETVVAPLNRRGDVEGCALIDGEVRLPRGSAPAHAPH